MTESVYITALGKFLPGSPISNDEMEDYLGMIGGKPSRLRARILKQNGIRSRPYAIDREGRVNYWNCELAARDAISRSEAADESDAAVLEPDQDGNNQQSSLMRRLAQVWVDFETQLNRAPIVDKLNRGKLRIEDYRLLLPLPD